MELLAIDDIDIYLSVPSYLMILIMLGGIIE